MTKNITPPEDSFQIRCPRLGHQISFSYCMNENNGLPCHKSLDCWYKYFPVYEFFQRKLSQEDWKKVFFQPPKPKILNIFELIQKAKKITKEKP